MYRSVHLGSTKLKCTDKALLIEREKKFSLDQQALRQQTKSDCRQFEGGGRRRVVDGRHHAVNDIRHHAQQNQHSEEHEPCLPLEAHGPPWRTLLELVLDSRREERHMPSIRQLCQ